MWADGENLTQKTPDPKPAGWRDNKPYQQPNAFLPHDGTYAIQIQCTPKDEGSLLRLYFEHLDRPAAEYQIPRIVNLNQILGSVVLKGKRPKQNESCFSSISAYRTKPEDVLADQSLQESVLRALDFSRPEFRPIAKAIRSRQLDSASALLIRHLRNRRHPVGPDIESEEIHPDYRTVADEVLKGRYGTLGWFANFSDHWTDARGTIHPWVLPDGTINWARENGHLNRHFHWLALARAWKETGKQEYAERFSFEVQDWVLREPFFWERCPEVVNLNTMDGTAFRLGYMNTSNIGRRCELTWWPAYETFRKSRAFNKEAHLYMLLGFIRQARLLMNPTSFAAHDDGGAHGAMALLQTGLLMPEFKESQAWVDEAYRRWDEVLKVQFYPDGSHVSGSTGYNWASINALEHLIELVQRTGEDVPERYMNALALALKHPMGISRPDQGQIDMNDGGWSMVDDAYKRIAEKFFPDRQDFLWMATRGERGIPPDFTSIYFPNSGHFAMRTGWGPKERYLFMDAGPFGASHGKNDKLNIYLALGSCQLISSGGRGSYDANPYSAYTGSTYAYNTVIVDDLPQQRIGRKSTHTGHVPENRQWVSNERVDVAEGVYKSGWHGAGKNVQGTHLRQVLFIKGPNPPETAYGLIIDTLTPNDDEEHEYKTLFHSRRNAVEIHPETKAFTGFDSAAAFRILPVDVEDLSVTDVIGQTEPYLQGWHVVGRNHAPMHTASYSWTAKGPTTRAWILIPSESEKTFCVDKVECVRNRNGTLEAVIHRTDGGTDAILRRPRSEPLSPATLNGKRVHGDLAIISRSAEGTLKTIFDSTEKENEQ